MKGRKKEKSVSLNKMLTVTVIIAYVVFLLLLLWMDTILVMGYRRERQNDDKQLLVDYVDVVNEHLERMEELIYDVYAYNDDFRKMSGPLTELEEFNCLYEINYIMRNRAALYPWISGYMLSYHDTGDWRYYFSSTVDSEYVDEMKAFLAERIRDGKDWDRLVAGFHDRISCLIFCRRDSVALCGVYDLGGSVPSYAAELESRGDVFFYSDGQVYGAGDEAAYSAADGQVYGAAGEVTGKTAAAAGEAVAEIEAAGNVAGETASVIGELVTAAGVADSFERSRATSEYLGKRIGGTDLWVIYKRPLTVFTFMNITHMLLLLFTFSTLVVFWFVYRYIRRDIFTPLQRLVETMNEVSRGNWDNISVHGSHLEEIQKVDEAFHVMVSEIRKQKILSYEQTIEKQKAQMQYLQLQLKPHFYLNGLKMLNVLAMEGDKQRIQDLIMRISYHLRYLLTVNRDLVCLGDEIEYTRNYENLQSEMMGRSFDARWDVPESVLRLKVPTLCIQTFVENSFKYAEVVAFQKLIIYVKVQLLETEDGDYLDIIVRDNGKGYPEHILKEINGKSEENIASVGIVNIKKRCRLIYGEKVEYSFCNEDGAVSEIVLPCDSGRGNDEDIAGR